MAGLSDRYTYGKMPIWQKIVLYGIGGVVVYGAVHFTYFSKKVTYASLGSIDQNTSQYNLSK